MIRNLDTAVLNFEGNPLKVGDPKIKRNADGSPVFDPATSEPIVLEHPKDFTMQAAFFTALGAQLEDDERMPADKKMELYRLGHKIAAGGEVELTLEDAALLKDRASKTFNYLTFGRIAEFLESK